jgi:hypothetical protein
MRNKWVENSKFKSRNSKPSLASQVSFLTSQNLKSKIFHNPYSQSRYNNDVIAAAPNSSSRLFTLSNVSIAVWW